MNTKDVLRRIIESGHFLTHSYVQDLNDEDLLVRSVPGTNHIAWQLGHMIAGSAKMLAAIGQPAPALPDGFAAAHDRDKTTIDDPSKFAKKAEYLALMEQIKAASLATVDAVPDNDLDKPGPEFMRQYAPTVGAVLFILGSHWTMHAGQFIPIRRKLGKAPLF